MEAINTSLIGQVLLFAALLLCGYCVVSSPVALLRRDTEPVRSTRRLKWAWYGSSLAVVGAFMALLVAFASDDFSIATVSGHSSSKLPTVFKIAAMWSGSEGSFLLWTTAAMVLFSLALARNRAESPRFHCLMMFFGGCFCVMMLACLIFVLKPFALASAAADQGQGLKHVLRDSWLVVHPPLVFLGYAALLVPVAMSMAAVFAGNTDDVAVSRSLRKWMLLALLWLTLGLASGSRWAYTEVGWSGYWSWDPVESFSLLVWLGTVAALHCLIGQKLSVKFRFYAYVMQPLPFVLMLAAAAVVRSGMPQSRHTFVADDASFVLLGAFAVCLLLWVVMLIRAFRTMSFYRPQLGTPILDRTGLLFWFEVILITVIGALGGATLAPLLSSALSKDGGRIVITASFYNQVISATGGILAFYIGLSVLAGLRHRTNFYLYAWGCVGVGFMCYGMIFKELDITILLALACGICAFSAAAVLCSLVINLIEGSAFGFCVAHGGLLVVIVAAGFAAGQRTSQSRLMEGSQMKLGSYELTYSAFNEESSEDMRLAGPVLTVKKGDGGTTVWPHKKVFSDGYTKAEAGIATRINEDVYIFFTGPDEFDLIRVMACRIPLMIWLWVGIGLVVLGTGIGWLENHRMPTRLVPTESEIEVDSV